RLVSAATRPRMRTLRGSVATIYKNRLHRHFTDHSIDHCDRVADLAERLLSRIERKLSDDEGIVLYGGAYLHDIGMHNENANRCRRMAAMLRDKGRKWADIRIEDRLDLIRKYHNEISADMVIASIRNGKAPIGFTLKDQDRPNEVAAICEAHCVDTAAPRF